MAVAKIENSIVVQVDRTTDEADEGWVACGPEVVCGMVFDGDAFSAPPGSPPPVPQTVTRFQAKAALQLAGKLAAAQALVDASIDPLVALAWNEAATFERQSPMLLAMAPLLWPEDTDAHLDEMFVSAAGISA